MKIKNFFKNISPFNNKENMPTALYVIKKVLAFFFVYGLAMAIGEVLIIGLLAALGYNPLNGVMPDGYWAELLKYYGFAVFFAVALFYSKIIEKRKPSTLGFNKKFGDVFAGGLIAVALLSVIIVICCVTNTLSFNGFGKDFDLVYLVAWFAAFFVQSLAEEAISRGFLLSSLSKKTSLLLAVFVSSTAFALPHLPTVFDADIQFAIIGVINLYLVSIVFSLLYLLKSNIYIVSGLHWIWNFVLNGVMGLSVSGSNGNEKALMNFTVESQNILSGGVYGLEASIITTVVLGIVSFVLIKIYCKRGKKNGF